MKLLRWIVGTYFPDEFVSREDFDELQERSPKDVIRLRKAVDELTRENNKLICDGLAFHALLPDFEGGTLKVETQFPYIRESFCTTAMVRVSDCDRYMRGPMRKDILSHLSKMLAKHIEKALLKKFDK